MTPDLSKMAVVGAYKRQPRYVVDQTVRKCECCDRRIYLSKTLLADAKRIANRQLQQVCVVCGHCVNPWLEDLSRNGGGIKGAKSVIESDIMPVIAKIRRDQIEAN